MRVIDSIPHKSMTINIFQMNDKYQVKFEAGPMEQIFKFLVEDIKGLDGLKQKIDETFIETTRLRFNEMYKQMM